MSAAKRAACALWVTSWVAASGCSEVAARIDGILVLEADPLAGEVLYAEACAACHGAAGEGGLGPSLVYHVPMHGDRTLARFVLTGPGGMPSFEAMDDQELADLLAYLRAAFDA